MKADLWLLAFFGLANASALIKRQDEGIEITYDPGYKKYDPKKPEYEPKKPEYDPKKPDYDPKKPEYDPKYPDKKPEYDPKYPEEHYDPKYPEKHYDPKYPEKHYDPKYPEKKPEYDPEYPEKHYDPKYPERGHKDEYPEKYDEKYPEKYDEKYPEKYPEWDDKKHDWDDKHDYYKDKHWKPKTNHPEFFSLKVDEKCDRYEEIESLDSERSCYFDNYAIRLERGIVIATPYNKWWDPKLPIFFVDSDTQLYTVSKKPLQIYIDAITGSMRYAPVGWLAPNAISLSFYKFGNNPLSKVDPSPAYLSWPSTLGVVEGSLDAAESRAKPFWLCPLGETGQYQVYVNINNFGRDVGSSGVYKDKDKCKQKNLAAINANPWKHHRGKWGGDKWDKDDKWDWD